MFAFSSVVVLVLKLALDSVIEPLVSRISTLVANEPLSDFKSVTRVLKLALDSVIEPLPSSNPTLVEKEPLSVVKAPLTLA